MSAIVVGLGDLGLAIARRLHEADPEVTGIDGAAERRRLWLCGGGPALAAVAALEELDGRPVFVCVRTTAQAEAVLADLGRLPGAERSRVYLVTTLEPAFARALADRSEPPGALELAVSGGRGGAAAGTLTALLGGPASKEEIAYLERTIAGRVFDFPRYGDATLAKLFNNALGGFSAYAFARLLLLAEEAGLDPATLSELVRCSSGGSWMAEHFGELVDGLLAKDAALLEAELGRLPTLDLGEPEAFLETLATVRELLSRTT